MIQQLVLDHLMHFTNLDFLLNTRWFEHVSVALIAICKALRQRYYERMLAEDADSSNKDSVSSDRMLDL